MSPRKPAALRGDDSQDLRGHLIATAARLLAERGSAGLGVRDIARAAQVADGVLYNYFDDKDDLLAQALLAHVAATFTAMPPLPAPGTGTVAATLAQFIDTGLAQLRQVAPAFAGLIGQPGVLARFHAMVGGDAAFGAADGDGDGDSESEARGEGEGEGEGAGADDRPGGLPDMLGRYLSAEQRLGRIAADADLAAATVLVVGAIHGEVLPRVIFSPPGRPPAASAPGLGARLAATVLAGIGPGAR